MRLREQIKLKYTIFHDEDILFMIICDLSLKGEVCSRFPISFQPKICKQNDKRQMRGILF